jgi:hypothetical protein
MEIHHPLQVKFFPLCVFWGLVRVTFRVRAHFKGLGLILLACFLGRKKTKVRIFSADSWQDIIHLPPKIGSKF